MSCDNIIDTGKCYIQGDTYSPLVLSVSQDGIPKDITTWTFYVEVKNMHGNIVKVFDYDNGLSYNNDKLIITLPKYFDFKKGEYIMYIGAESVQYGKKTFGGLRFYVTDKKIG